MKRKIAAVLVIAAGALGSGVGAGAVTASATELPLVGGSSDASERTILPGVPVPFPEQLVEPSRNLSTTLTPIVAPI